ncbi:hypothetical protein BM526_20460 (plasmid) [Alteromonas mediterranea]|uniref:hypothetical protein n=1 Tax=Alteromonas mediterranea TaxID=314275 RepID=UPI000903BE89|nr:hypothetical protein [Alteromonas mediterranea]APE04347.1 hypothetical protein BM526_20460 [Alteromonas mediterranea]
MEFVIKYFPLALSCIALIIALQARSIVKNIRHPITEEEQANFKQDFDEAILCGNKPAAMKAYRNLKGCGLKEAKAHVEGILSSQPNN